MENVTEVRLTLAAFIYSIEIDLKDLIKKYVVPFHSDISFFRNKQLEENVRARYKKEIPDINIDDNLSEAVDFIDFQDTFITLLANQAFVPTSLIDEVKKKRVELEGITPIRNRVMHTRPLLGGDFATVYEFVSTVQRKPITIWPTLLSTKDKIEKDPNYVLTLTVPITRDNKSNVVHNLPIPDFDETGFIGRKRDAEEIKRLILSNRVVSILGDGGIGKTALALKVIYDIVDMNDKCPFDLIIWTSAKTTM